MFTKQQCKILAELIKKSYNYQVFIENLIRVLYYDNPKFNEKEFRKNMSWRI